jgi:hypothetical protein
LGDQYLEILHSPQPIDDFEDEADDEHDAEKEQWAFSFSGYLSVPYSIAHLSYSFLSSEETGGIALPPAFLVIVQLLDGIFAACLPAIIPHAPAANLPNGDH